MTECILVWGCGRSSRGSAEQQAALSILNERLLLASVPVIATQDFSTVHVVEVPVRATRRRPPSAPHLFARQVHAMVTDEALRVRAAELVADAITAKTKVVIAHSWGSVAAYEALCLLPRHNVTHFFTLGSPLAIPFFVRGRLSTLSAFGRHAWPGTLQQWFNFADGRDPVAWWRLRRHFGNGGRVEELKVRMGSANPHNLLGYLSTTEFVNCLGDALLSGSPFSSTVEM